MFHVKHAGKGISYKKRLMMSILFARNGLLEFNQFYMPCYIV